MHRQLLVFFTLFSAFRFSIAASASDWRSRSIYQAVTDRFARSDGSLTSPCDPKDRRYCGGTWRGMINRLDYIQGMGFTAIWISPIVQQISGDTFEGEAYHGYWPQNIYALNPNFGTEQDFKDLVAACHSRGMYLMVDTVINHFANRGEIVNYQAFVPFSDERFFHPRCEIDWGNQTSIERCWMGNGYVSLADIDTENPTVIEIWKEYLVSFIPKYKIDGLFASTPVGISRNRFGANFLVQPMFTPKGRYGIGIRSDVICPYQEHMDSLHNYPFKELATDAFVSSAGSMAELVKVARQMQVQSKDITLFGTFMENHDNPRLGSFTTDIARLRNLAVLNILTDGVPVVYYGQEQALTGSNDPLNREALWLTGYSTTNNLVPTFTVLNTFRNYLVKSATSFITTLATYTLLSSSVINVRKGNVVLVLTNSGEGCGYRHSCQ
ncbi:Alpha-amylase [Mycena venus]|uniref:alpha-amylase n=1 Tax=Mycena venus TaxID=2733690 RepID=A0A8H7CLZ6_9AGAR|nr:Alpha-amylase [Mycena venus]